MKDLTKEEMKKFILQCGIRKRTELVSFIIGYKSCLTLNEWDAIWELKGEGYLED